MAIPGSGAISMSMFNTELGRASNTANSSLAGGSTPAVGSLFWLANQSGSLNQTAPHAMSEWYGYTASPSYTVSLYGKLDSGNAPPIDPQFYVSVDNGSTYNLVGSLINNTTCTLEATVVTTSGNIRVRIVDPNNTTVQYGFYWASGNDTCPSSGTTIFELSRNISANSGISFNAVNEI